jgi:hypothetical protein
MDSYSTAFRHLAARTGTADFQVCVSDGVKSFATAHRTDSQNRGQASTSSVRSPRTEFLRLSFDDGAVLGTDSRWLEKGRSCSTAFPLTASGPSEHRTTDNRRGKCSVE